MTLRRLTPPLCLAAALSLALFPAGAAGETVNVSYPGDYTLVAEDLLPVEGYVTDPDLPAVEIELNGAPYTLARVRDFLFSAEVYLDGGANVLRVGGEVLHVFLARGEEKAPEKYRRLYGHFGLVDGCAECHVVTGKGKFAFDGEPGKVCLWCHDELTGRRGGEGGSVHGPAREGQCLKCHLPHISAGKSLLVEKVPGCRQCHPAVFEGLEKDRYVHGPLNLGDCRLCHDIHASKNLSLLVEKPTSLCTQCHSEVAIDPAAPPELSPHVMIPQGLCGRCHSPHSSDNPMMMREPPGRVCNRCHPEKTRSFHEEKGFSIYACQRCHDLHRPTTEHLIADSSRSLCLDCHRFREDARFSHEFIAGGRCFTCHSFHTAPLSGEIADLCLRCHGGNPRLGEAHGGVAVEKSRCTSCHLPHQADKEKLILDVEHTPFRERRCGDCHEARAALMGGERSGLCRDCHTGKGGAAAGGGTAHPPVEEKGCGFCHLDHVSREPALLRRPELDICVGCHEEFRRVKVVRPKSSHEFVLLGECHRCHDVHGSPNRSLLRSPVQEICGDCHAALLQGPDGAGWEFPHPPVRDSKCRLCHLPHTARIPGLLKSRLPQPCRPCHGGFFTRLKEAGEAGTHRPVAQGRCDACHEIHGSRGENLVDPLSRRTLCSNCHPRVTGGHHLFAPGELAEKTGIQEANPCQTCHLPHASTERKLLKGRGSPACQGCHGGR